MSKKNEYKMFTNIPMAIALQRSRALPFIKPSKWLDMNGEFTEYSGLQQMFPSFSLQDLIDGFKSSIDFPITGVFEDDIRNAVGMIVVSSFLTGRNPFRVWYINNYIDCSVGSKMPVIIGDNGLPFVMRVCADARNQNRLIYALEKDEETTKNLEIEWFTGFFDQNDVPIFENDVLVTNNMDYWTVAKKGKGTANHGWYADGGSEINSTPLDEDSRNLNVIGSSRNSKEILKSIQKVIQKMHK